MPTTIVVVVGVLLLVNFVVINPLLAGTTEALLRLVVLLAAAASLAGGAALVLRHGGDLLRGHGDRLGSLVLLIGLAAMLLAGFYPGSTGATDPAVRWLVAALLAPLIASVFAMLFVFLLGAMRQGMSLRSREMGVMLAAAGVMVVLLLPVGGAPGEWMAAAAGWVLAVPVGAVFRGMLIGVAVVTAIHAARILLAVDGADD